MRQITVMLGILVVLMLVIFSSTGAQQFSTYMSQSVFQGQTVFLTNEMDATVNNESAVVVHTGMVFTHAFEIREIVDDDGNKTMIVDHSTGGNLGKPEYVFTTIANQSYVLQEDADFGEWVFTYYDTIQTKDGRTLYIYDFKGVKLGVNDLDYCVIEESGRYVVLKQTANTLSVTEIEPPFDMGYVDIFSLGLMVVLIAIVAYWYARTQKDWKVSRR
jgi:hypothetical protein